MNPETHPSRILRHGPSLSSNEIMIWLQSHGALYYVAFNQPHTFFARADGPGASCHRRRSCPGGRFSAHLHVSQLPVPPSHTAAAAVALGISSSCWKCWHSLNSPAPRRRFASSKYSLPHKHRPLIKHRQGRPSLKLQGKVKPYRHANLPSAAKKDQQGAADLLSLMMNSTA